MTNILIFGFPHCGTTILRCIMGHINDVHEVMDEIYMDDEHAEYLLNLESNNKKHEQIYKQSKNKKWCNQIPESITNTVCILDGEF